MDKSSVIYLIAYERTQDELGRWQKEKTSRKVYCQVDSVTRSEFFDAGRNGLNPEFRFTMLRFDYHNEAELEYNGKTYAIYRTYERRNDYVELYVERKGGTNAKSNDG